MGNEQDSWFKPFGFDPGKFAAEKLEALKQKAAAVVPEGAKALVEKAKTAVSSGVKTVTGAVSGAPKPAAPPKPAKPAAGPAAPPAEAATGGGGSVSSLTGSVGAGGKNNPDDVKAVQTALKISADGKCGPGTIGAIKTFQKSIGQANPDGRVDPGGATSKALAGSAAPAPAPPAAPDAPPAPAPAAAPTPAKEEGFFEGLKNKAVKKFEEVAGAVKGLDVKSDVKTPFNSGAPLNQGSAVAGTPASSLTGGGTASAGDSFFVTGGQKGQLLARAQSIRGAAKQFDEVAKELQKKGAGGMFSSKDDKLLASAKNMAGIADGMLKLASAIDSWTGDGNKDSITKGSTAVDYVSKIIDAADAIMAIKKLNTSLNELEKKPSQASVEAWADDVGNAFDKAGNLIGIIPKGALPGFIVDYYKGLFSAPKNFINAFKIIMHARYDKIDMEAGISKANQRATSGDKVEWEGDLVPLFIHAHFQPKTKNGTTLTGFMQAHRKIAGVDLYKSTLREGKALLTTAIGTDIPDDDDGGNTVSVKQAWLSYVEKF